MSHKLKLNYSPKEIATITQDLKNRYEEVLEINIILQLERLQTGKWSVANTHFKAHEYEMLQYIG